MKRFMPAITAALLLLCMACSNQNHKGEALLSIKNSETSYTFTASFYAGSTPEVNRYLDSCASVLRKGNANFRIKISDGDLTITAAKQANSAVGMRRIRAMCQGIGAILIRY